MNRPSKKAIKDFILISSIILALIAIVFGLYGYAVDTITDKVKNNNRIECIG